MTSSDNAWSGARYTVPTLLLTLLLCLLLLATYVATQRAQLLRDVEASGLQLALASREALAADDTRALDSLARSTLHSRYLRGVAIINGEGAALVERQRPIHDVIAEIELAAYLLKPLVGYRLQEAYVVPVQAPPPAALVPAQGEFDPIGWVVVEPAVAEFARDQAAGFVATLLLSLLVIFLVVLVTSLRGRRRRRALRDIRAAIARMKEGDLQARVASPVGGVLGELAAEVNRMAAALYKAQLELEAKVEETTSELRQTLEAVEIQNVELDLARKRALEASKVKSEFLANMSHEIRTPINGILGFADLLSHSPLDEEQRDYVNTVKDSCANLLTIVNDILDFSKIEAGKLAIDSVAFDLRDSVEEVLSLLAPTAYGKALELLHLIYADVPLKLYGDPIRIRQVLTNLVHNAIKFTPSGRVVVRVMLEDESEQDALLRITVTDTGIGLSPEDQAKLFTAFGQADTSITRRFGGAGLGLIISRKLVEQMGGSIGFESEQGNGSTFWFTLRCLKQRAQQGNGEPRDKPLQQRRVLIYDEDGLSRLALKHVLEGWQMRVTEVDERQRFISLVGAQSRWDLVIIGLNRAELNARTFHGLMPRLRHIDLPILVLASTVDRNELRSLYQQGARAALPKALRRQTLFREICRLCSDEPSTPPQTTRALAHEATPPPRSRREAAAEDLLVLVVDDNRINRKLVSTILGIHGVRVLEAEDGKEAVDVAREQPLDLIFMDIHMPTMSGETAARHIQAQQGKRRPPKIIALTANAMPGERERLLAAGMDDCLIKPISEEQVVEILAGLREPAAEQPALEQPAAAAPTAAGDDAAKRPQLLDELKAMLEAELPSHRKAIQSAYRGNRLGELKDAVHKLHGAASVCRLESLRAACADLEAALKKDDVVMVPAGVRRLMEEIDQLRDEAASS